MTPLVDLPVSMHSLAGGYCIRPEVLDNVTK